VLAVPDTEVLLDHVRAHGDAVLAGGHDVALARDHVAGAEDGLVAREPPELLVGPLIELVLHRDARHGLGDAADRAHHERRVHVLECPVDGHGLAVLDPCALEAEPGKAITLDDQADRQPERTDREAVFLHRLLEDLPSRRLELLGLGRVGALRDLGERHVLDPPPVIERRTLQAELVPGEPMLGEHRGDALVLELLHVLVDALLGERVAHTFELEHLHDVDRREPPADDDRPVERLVAGTVVGPLGEVVEPVDEGVLVDEPLADVRVGTFDRQRPIAPRAVGEDDGREPPALGQVLEVDVTPDAGVRDEVDAGTIETGVDGLVLILAELHVPAREPVLDLAVRTGILLEDDGGDAAGGEHTSGLGPGGGSPHDRHHVLRAIRHGARRIHRNASSREYPP
jgi:hypothetical protein